jgi:hypothetical protein
MLRVRVSCARACWKFACLEVWVFPDAVHPGVSVSVCVASRCEPRVRVAVRQGLSLGRGFVQPHLAVRVLDRLNEDQTGRRSAQTVRVRVLQRGNGALDTCAVRVRETACERFTACSGVLA